MKKYRTKSGKVEEKLPGINATVSPSEKVQIAMAGGANTLGDVQTILGQQGKRNNLKGQGAKHLMSFQGFSEGPEEYSGDTYGSDFGYGGEPGGVAEPTLADPTPSDFGKYGEPGGIARPDPGFGKYGEPSGIADPIPSRHKQSNLPALPVGFEPELGGGKVYNRALHTLPDRTNYQDPDYWIEREEKNWKSSFGKEGPSLFDYGKREIDKLDPYSYAGNLNIEYMRKLNLASGLASLATIPVSPITGAAGVIKSVGVEAFYKSFRTPDPEDQIPMPGMTSKEAEDYADLYAPSDLSDFKPDEGIEIKACPSGSTKSASGACLPITSNNTTLAVVDKKDTEATREELRRAKRQTTRYA